MTFDQASDAFEADPSNDTAADLLEAAMQYESDDMIGRETFFHALTSVKDYLRMNP